MKEFNFTILLFTFNEEKRIELVLKNFIDFAYIVVLDDGSTDQTIEVALKYGAKVLRRPKINRTPGYNDKYIAKWALDQSTTEYVYVGYCSHFVPLKLIQLFDKVAKKRIYKAVFHGYLAVTYGKYIDRPILNRKSNACHFFSKSVIKLERSKIHNEWPIESNGSKVFTADSSIDYSIHVFRDYNSKRTEIKHSDYADIEAKERFDRGERTTGFKIFWRGTKHFLYGYILNGGFRGGVPGLLYHMWWAQMVFNIQARIWEYQKAYTEDRIESLNFSMRENLIEEMQKANIKNRILER